MATGSKSSYMEECQQEGMGGEWRWREPSYGQRGETGTHDQHIHRLPCWGRGGQQAGMEMTLCLPHSLSLPLQCPGLGQALAPGA